VKTGFGATLAVVFIEAVKFTGVELAVADSDEVVVMEIENRLEVEGTEAVKLKAEVLAVTAAVSVESEERLEVGGTEFDKLDEEEHSVLLAAAVGVMLELIIISEVDCAEFGRPEEVQFAVVAYVNVTFTVRLLVGWIGGTEATVVDGAVKVLTSGLSWQSQVWMIVDVEFELLLVGEISVIEALSMEAEVGWWGGQGIVSPTTRNEKLRRGMRISTVDRMLAVGLGPVPLHVQGVRSPI